MNYSHNLANLKIKAVSKKLLLLAIALLTITFGINGQGIFSGSYSSTSYFICNSQLVNATGSNYAGQLGDGTLIDKLTPISLSGLSGITQIGSGLGHVIYLKDNGTVWACGSNYSGELGATPTEAYTTAVVQVSGLSNIISVATGSQHSLFLKSDGTVWA